MNIAVTAATGHLGSEIVNALKALPGERGIVAIARTPEKAKGLGVEVRRGDYNEKQSFEAALAGIDTLLLVSGMDAPDRRIGQHRNVIEAAASQGVKKIVYTSVQGPESGADFSPIVASNRQTEKDVRESGLDWVIGRNGIYIEPDIEAVEAYKKAGGVTNCAGDGKCGYTTRPELAYAYAHLLSEQTHSGKTYNLHGEALTQGELVRHINRAFGTNLAYRAVSVEDFRKDRIAELGEFLGTIITGIYVGISQGAFDNPSDYSSATGRPHQTWDDYFAALASANTKHGD